LLFHEDSSNYLHLERLENKESYKYSHQDQIDRFNPKRMTTNTSDLSLMFKNRQQEALLHQIDANVNRRYTSKSGKKSKDNMFTLEDSSTKLTSEISEALLRKRLNVDSQDRLSKIKLKLPANFRGRKGRITI
jgi:glycosylphosphatidylinositol transamidase (GPIT) subunit GPI8